MAKPDWHERAKRLALPTRALINGREVSAASGKTFSRISPIDGRMLGEVAACEAEDVDLAVKAARAAFEDGRWSGKSPRERKQILQRFAELILDHREALALTETLDMGKPIADSLAIDVPATANCIAWYAEAIDKVYGEIAPTARDSLGLILREPLGVIGAVVPWNFPMLMASWKLGPALATGNSVVLKPAEQSPLSALRLGALALEAGIPEGVFNVVPGLGEMAGQALGRHPDVDMIAFTGSSEVGKYFLRYAGESNMKRVALECGGKSPNIVLPDAPDLDVAARAAAAGVWFNQGEMCTSASRRLVHDAIRDEFVAKVAALAGEYRPGDPLSPETRLGALVEAGHMDRVLSYIDSGKREGAHLVTGGARARTESGGFYVEPTVFGGVRPDMKIAREEIFGPVLSTIGFGSLDEALAIANDSIYGLGAAVWSRDVSTVMKAARALRAGVVYVNCYDGDDITTPFGGFKQSGFGRDKSLHAMDKYTDLKTVWIRI
jgi:gamma-glutamyl-gamma-aminobutyraldehyde dehydrogenase/4-guanidinobutyraldehyde dehydrogenase/NAD-dependent aldehyde dehydrogenase